MVVFAIQDTRLIGSSLGDTSNIDIQPISDIYPSRIDDIVPIASNPFPDPWIHIEKIFPLYFAVVRGVAVFSHVVIIAHHGQCLRRHLNIEIPIPWENLRPVSPLSLYGNIRATDLPVPPPPEQCPMSYPSLDPLLRGHLKPRFRQMR